MLITLYFLINYSCPSNDVNSTKYTGKDAQNVACQGVVCGKGIYQTNKVVDLYYVKYLLCEKSRS